ncbi:MAG TPA: cytochrome c oxidase assembly protein [Solirubrobacteraceae bacterium]|nr:cytochrome c oxidase assembly protein [Solirubrobacteraceae bacterium]
MGSPVSWHGWSVQPPLAYVVAAALLYGLGGTRYSRAARTRERWREAAFALGLVTIVLALESPLDGYADRLFWMHMLQHVMLLSVAPPLILLGRPWPRMWLGLPVGLRTTVGRTLARARWTAGVRWLARPRQAWGLFNATLIGWHIPAAYDVTLRNQSIHDLEHAMFFFTGLLFWAHIVDPGPLRARLSWPLRLAYLVGSMVVGWMLAVTLVMVSHPIYSPYAAVGHRPGGISALNDQQLAAGVMWVIGSLPYSVVLFIGLYRWLEPDRRAKPRPAITT